MNKRLILGLMIVLGVFTTSLMAAEFEAPKIPSETLTESDLKLIDDAISSEGRDIRAELMKLKLSLSTSTPMELGHQLDKIIEKLS